MLLLGSELLYCNADVEAREERGQEVKSTAATVLRIGSEEIQVSSEHWLLEERLSLSVD